MAQFVAFAPDAELIGQSMLVTIEAMGSSVLPLLKKHGIENIHPDRWYPQQPFLDFFRDVASGDFSSVFDLVSIGMKAPEIALWPENVKSIQDALFSIGEAYKMNHRGSEFGYYKATQTGEREIEMECKNPYPCDFDYGLVYNTAKLYLPADGQLTVEHAATGRCRQHGDDVCTYIVSW
jgi:hypothetical protein